jgi:trans-aconitate 2-methyltransferase
MQWDPVQYSRYANERSRPFFDLTGQVAAADPTSVVDLGCGPGELTAALAQRWPNARIRGLDSSAEMIAQANSADPISHPVSDPTPNLMFELASAEDFHADATDVLVSNATLQWVPNHRELLRRWARELRPDGWLAFQVPANFDAPSHRLMREVAARPRWRASLEGTLRDELAVLTPSDYLNLLSEAGLTVNVWQTSYLHVLVGRDPVLEWVRGTGLRPILQALTPADAEDYAAEYAAELRAAYPPQALGTVFPFLRTFVVAHKASERRPRSEGAAEQVDEQSGSSC